MEVSTGYTVGAYSFLIAIVASYVYLRVIKVNGPRARQPTQLPPVETKAEPKKKKARADGNKNLNKKDKVTAAKTEEQQPQWLSNIANEKEAPVDDREFAKQLTSLKEGKKFDRRNGEAAANRHKSVKQSRAAQVADFDAARTGSATTGSSTTEEKASVSAPSAPSSSTGADGSAEPTPDASPIIAPADTTGVADMLAPTPTGPGVLRLVDTQEDKPKATNSKPNEVKETKKQRQNRRKAEELKAAREAAEVERKKLEEVQRRTARVAEGRPARDGTQSTMVFGKQAWNSDNSSKSAMTPSSSFEILDTDSIDNDEAAPVSTPAPAPVAAAPKTKSLKVDDSWMSELPSEEEQMKMAKADAEWSTVTTKASRKSKKDAPAQDASAPAAASAPVEPVALATPKASSESRPSKALKPTGSFAALSTPTDAADEEEVEWDV
jgi:type II secretory pathway pseudopilin PulG